MTNLEKETLEIKLQNIIRTSNDTSPNHISVFNVLCLLDLYKATSDAYKEYYKNLFNQELSDFYIENFNINSNKMYLHVVNSSKDTNYLITFSIKDNDLIILYSTNDEATYYILTYYILKKLGDQIKKCIFYYDSYEGFIAANKKVLTTFNYYKKINFTVKFNKEYLELQSNTFDTIRVYLNKDNDYSCLTDSLNNLEILKGYEEMLLKSIYVNIEDMPEWMREELYYIRQCELNIKEEIDNSNIIKESDLYIKKKN